MNHLVEDSDRKVAGLQLAAVVDTGSAQEQELLR